MPWKDLASRSKFSAWPLSAHASMESAKAVQEVSPTPPCGSRRLHVSGV